MDFLNKYKRVLITGGGGFIGGSLIRKLLTETNIKIYNLDKLGYASNTLGINKILKNFDHPKERYELIKVDLSVEKEVKNIFKIIDPDMVFHLAAESHVDNSIIAPRNFLNSNIVGTFNILEESLNFYQSLKEDRKKNFFFQHISTDEVYGSLENKGSFTEKSPYSPNSPYAASKAASDHLVRCWHKTYGLPIKITNCSNNYGPWQHSEKLIPKSILNCFENKQIPIYGRGNNIRDWLFIDDHIEALLCVMRSGKIGETYCIGGANEMNNLDVIKKICSYIDLIQPSESPKINLVSFTKDRLGHDHRYAIDFSKIKNDLGWTPKYKFDIGIEKTINWYFERYKKNIGI